MICAAVSGPTARSTRNAITRISQANSGIFPRVIPGQRKHRIVVRMLIAVPMLPMPETRSDSVQKSVLCPRENVCEVSGAYANHPTSGALPAPYKPLAPSKLKYRRSPPNAVSQKLNAFRRGNAMSRAPSISGSR